MVTPTEESPVLQVGGWSVRLVPCHPKNPKLTKKPNQRLGMDGFTNKRQKLRKRFTNFATWNTQGISGKTEEIVSELDKLNIDVIALTETKKKGQGTAITGNYVHIYSGVPKHERAKRGVSIMIHKKYRNKIKDWEAIDENLIRININILQRNISIIAVYAISDDEPTDKKDDFFCRLNSVIQSVGNNREIILLGDFNSRTGSQRSHPVVGPFGEDRSNDNGNRLIDTCQINELKITNGFFKHKLIHKYTWIQNTRNLKSIIDYVIVRQGTTLKINDVRVYRGALCDSDHYVVKAKIYFPWHQSRMQTTNNQTITTTDATEEITYSKFNLGSLSDESTRTLFKWRLDRYLTDSDDANAEELYQKIKIALQKSADEALGMITPQKSRKLWWNSEVENMIDEKKRKYIKWLTTKDQDDRQAYLEIRRQTRNKIATEKRNMWDKKCKEIDTYVGGRKSTESWRFINKLKNPGQDAAQIGAVSIDEWIKHYEQLLTESRPEYMITTPTEIYVEGETVTVDTEVVKNAISKLKNGKAPGPGGIPAELIKYGTDKLFQAITNLVNKCLNGDPVPDEWKTAYISSIHKKGDKSNCSNYRGISVTCTFSRLYGRILRDLIENEYHNNEEEEQSGFRAGRSCVDNIFCLKQLIEKYLGRNQEVHLMFIDLKKAYDNIPIKKLWRVLQETNINQNLITALKNLYNESKSQIKIRNKLSKAFNVDKGLRQGCCVSPTLFKIYISQALQRWKKKCRPMGIDIGDIHLYTLQFADDQVIVANDRDDLEYMARKLQQEYEIWGLELNTHKTKYLPIGSTQQTNIKLENNEEVEVCTEYSYLGVIFDSSGSDTNEIRKRITQAKKAIGSLNSVFWSREIGKGRKYNIYNSMIKSNLLYGAETWRITEENKRRLETVEMDVFRRSLGISRLQKIRNEEIRRQMGVNGTLTTDIETKQLTWYGHVQRMNNERLPKKVMEWIPAYRRKRGRPKKTWKEGVVKAMSLRDLRQDQWNDRKGWRLGIGQRRKTF